MKLFNIKYFKNHIKLKKKLRFYQKYSSISTIMLYIWLQLDYLKKSFQEGKRNSADDGRISFEPAEGKVVFYNPILVLCYRIIPYGEHTLHTSIYYTHIFTIEIYNVLLLISNISARVMFLLTKKMKMWKLSYHL